MEPLQVQSDGALPPAATQLPNSSSLPGAMPQTSTPLAASSTPSLAEDNDLIEPEWVAALKQTLIHYRHDPYALSQAVTALREDYLMKRYGKRVEPAT